MNPLRYVAQLGSSGTCPATPSSPCQPDARNWKHPCFSLASRDCCGRAGHTMAVTALAFSNADNGYLASASADTTAKIWDPLQGLLLKTLEGHTKVRRRSFGCLPGLHQGSASFLLSGSTLAVHSPQDFPATSASDISLLLQGSAGCLRRTSTRPAAQRTIKAAACRAFPT